MAGDSNNTGNPSGNFVNKAADPRLANREPTQNRIEPVNEVTKQEPIESPLEPVKDDVNHKPTQNPPGPINGFASQEPIKSRLEPVKEDANQEPTQNRSGLINELVKQKPIESRLEPVKENANQEPTQNRLEPLAVNELVKQKPIESPREPVKEDANQKPTQNHPRPANENIYRLLNDLRPGSTSFKAKVNEFVDGCFKESYMREALCFLSKRLQLNRVTESQIESAQALMEVRLQKIWCKEVFKRPGKYIESPEHYYSFVRELGDDYQTRHPENPLPASVIEGVKNVLSTLKSGSTDTSSVSKTNPTFAPPVKSASTMETKPSLADRKLTPGSEPYRIEKRSISQDRFSDKRMKISLAVPISSQKSSQRPSQRSYERPYRRQTPPRTGLNPGLGESANGESGPSGEKLAGVYSTPKHGCRGSDVFARPKREALDQMSATRDREILRGGAVVSAWAKRSSQDAGATPEAAASATHSITSGPSKTPIVDYFWSRRRVVKLSDSTEFVTTVIGDILKRDKPDRFQSYIAVGQGLKLNFSVDMKQNDGLMRRLSNVFHAPDMKESDLRPALEKVLGFFVRANSKKFDDLPRGIFAGTL